MLCWAREGESPLSELGAQPRCGVAVCFRESAQAGARPRRSGGGILHNVGQITLRLSNMDVVHEGAELVSNSERIGSQCSHYGSILRI